MIGSKVRMKAAFFRATMPVLVFMLVFCIACTPGMRKDGPLVFSPVSPQPDQAVLKPGLAVIYFDSFYRLIVEMPRTDQEVAMEGRPGKPIPYMNHQFGEGEVFDSGRSKGVGMHITGFIHFPEAGSYMFRTMSNDGVRIYINNKVILNDPDVHGDRLSPPSTIEVTKAGWCAFKVLYFQRKGTARIELHWKTPGSNDFAPIPAQAFAHQPK